MRQHYYLIASLPMLRFDAPPPMSSGDFKTRCREQVNDSDYRLICSASLSEPSGPPGSSSVLASWNRWETSLRNALVRLRAQRLGWDPHQYLRETEEYLGLGAVIQEAAAAADPLEAEKLLARSRWACLEELEVGHHFDTERLVVYALKLQLLERQGDLSRERGEAEFERLRDSLAEQIHSGDGYE